MDEPTVTGADVHCRLCGTPTSASVFASLVLHSASIERVVEDDDADAAASQQQQRVRAVVKEPCPKCKNPELQYYTMQ